MKLAAYRRWRQRRSEILPGLVPDPVWDMLVALLEDEQRGRLSGVTATTLASLAPSTTALRYIAKLEELGLIARGGTCADRRKQFLRLTEQGRSTIACALIGMVDDLPETLPFTHEEIAA